VDGGYAVYWGGYLKNCYSWVESVLFDIGSRRLRADICSMSM
jgi:hypothetical protein